MHGNNPTRDSIERALDFAVTEGLIRSWKRVDMHPYGRAKWEVEVHPNVHSADGLGTYPIRTYQEGLLFCAALASARSGLRPKIDAWAGLVGEYRAALDIEPGADPTEAGAGGDMELDAYADSFRDDPAPGRI
jgi:hypothetical protein